MDSAELRDLGLEWMYGGASLEDVEAVLEASLIVGELEDVVFSDDPLEAATQLQDAANNALEAAAILEAVGIGGEAYLSMAEGYERAAETALEMAMEQEEEQRYIELERAALADDDETDDEISGLPDVDTIEEEDALLWGDDSADWQHADAETEFPHQVITPGELRPEDETRPRYFVDIDDAFNYIDTIGAGEVYFAVVDYGGYYGVAYLA